MNVVPPSTRVSGVLLPTGVLMAGIVLAGSIIVANARTLGPQRDGAAAVPDARALDEARQLQAEAERFTADRQFKEAVDRAERALALRRQQLGERHPDVAQSIARLGIIAYHQGDYARAEKFAAEALAIREAVLPPDHLDVAESLSDLASMLLVRGDYVRPEPLFQRALSIYEKNPSAASADVQIPIADVFNNLGQLNYRRGSYDRAEGQYLRALEIKERVRGGNDPSVAEVAANLGSVYYAAKQYDKAVQVLSRALTIQERNLPSNHPSLATSSGNLAAVYFDQGDFDNAERLFQRALTIDEQQLDPRHPRLAVRLMGLAEVLRLKGEYARAEPMYERAFTIREAALGAAHPRTADALIGRSLLRYATGDFAGAVDLLGRGAALREQNLSLILTGGSEEAKRQYLRSIADESDIAVSLHLGSAPASSPAATLALRNVLERKGRAIDAMAGHLAALRGRLEPADSALLNQLSQAQSRLAAMILAGVSTVDQKQTVASLRGDVQRLEETISARSAEFKAASRSATVQDIQNALPPDGALVEFVSYRPFHVTKKVAEAYGPRRYGVYVLRSTGIVASADLGEASEIDGDVQRLRQALSAPADSGVRRVARGLYERLVRPIEAALTNGGHVIVSPDGALNLIPFAALLDPQDRFLVETRTVSYVTSGRDLARLSTGAGRSAGGSAPVILANPQFAGLAGNASPVPASATRAVDAATLDRVLTFSALPGTADEAVALGKVLPEARVFTGADATEAVLKGLRAPSILHIATHGFFLGPAARSAGPSDRGLAVTTGPPSSATNPDDALVLSGLALAGANQRWSGAGEDGIVTALEAASLDLWGTRMVVLSACETGVGDARNGEGVYGLRRALVLAGAESQVMSLWQVSDTATRDLMIAFYEQLRAGDGRAEALRRVQLAMLKGGRNRDHPYYWASFILSGDWRSAFN
jgi:CHAT domain-containing protein/Tfp pilus assembly protein PilF